MSAKEDDYEILPQILPWKTAWKNIFMYLYFWIFKKSIKFKISLVLNSLTL